MDTHMHQQPIYSTNTTSLKLFTFSCNFIFLSLFLAVFVPSHSALMNIFAGTAFPQAFGITPLYVLALPSANEIVFLGSPCKLQSMTVVMVARQRKDNEEDVTNMSCEMESTSAVL